jgi:uncharacterized protein DUF3500
MKLARIALAVTLLGGLGALAYVGQQAEPAGTRMVVAAQQFVDSLSAEQKKIALYDFDSKERTTWYFVPKQDAQRKPTRKGLPLQDMNPSQKKAARALLAASTSAVGNEQAVTIMSLEAILHEQESKKGKPPANVRDPEWYFFTIFGAPDKTGKWGWRVEGHHLSLHFTMDGAQVVSATPAFYGANPATVVSGEKKGHRTLAAAEDYAWDLFKALDDDQKKIAYQEKKFPEISTTVTPKVGEPVGLPASKMTEPQRGILRKVIHAYVERMPADVASAELKLLKDAGTDKICFAFNGGLQKGERHTYRVQGPTFLVEFINDQTDSAGNVANHIHSVWRRIKGDFGLN